MVSKLRATVAAAAVAAARGVTGLGRPAAGIGRGHPATTGPAATPESATMRAAVIANVNLETASTTPTDRTAGRGTGTMTDTATGTGRGSATGRGTDITRSGIAANGAADQSGLWKSGLPPLESGHRRTVRGKRTGTERGTARGSENARGRGNEKSAVEKNEKLLLIARRDTDAFSA